MGSPAPSLEVETPKTDDAAVTTNESIDTSAADAGDTSQDSAAE